MKYSKTKHEDTVLKIEQNTKILQNLLPVSSMEVIMECIITESL